MRPGSVVVPAELTVFHCHPDVRIILLGNPGFLPGSEPAAAFRFKDPAKVADAGAALLDYA
ncbi:MAG: hypothetical protein CMJ39_00290 [Phycisphaerae bacterium]|nr:hypothetical protein [Phycisphaerae bacterium]